MNLRMRGGSGLGDTIYLRVVAEHLARQGHAVTACSEYPGAFLGAGVRVEPFSRFKIDRVAHYTQGKGRPGTTQWQDVCIAAGVGDVPLRVDWKVQNGRVVRDLRDRAAGRPLVLVQGGRVPMGRKDGFGKELLPSKRAFDAAVACFSDCLTVQVGDGEAVYAIDGIEHSVHRTTVVDLLDLFASCDMVICQVSFSVPMAEIFDKPLLAVWAKKGVTCDNEFIARITPEKILSNKAREMWVVDDWPDERIKATVDAFRQL